MKFNKAGLLVMVLALLLGLVKAVWADDADLDTDVFGAKKTDFIKQRSYIGVIGVSATIDQWGDFNGATAIGFDPVTTVNAGVTTVTYKEQDLIPAITRQFGWGVLLGHREGPWAAEISFWRSDHTGTWTGTSSGAPVTFTFPASLQAINFDFKRYFFTQVPTQPFISLGVSFPWLWVQGASFGSTNISDETISGIGLNLGAGMEIYLDNNFSILGGLYQRWGEFDQINGAAKVPLNQMTFDSNNADVGSLAGNGLNIYVGGTVGVE